MTDALMFHGGRLSDAYARFGGRPEEWLDLSTGINPCAWPHRTVKAIDWQALPDPGALLRLEERAAAFFGVAPTLCCAVPGSEAGLRALARIVGLPGCHLALTYGTHAQAFAQAKAVCHWSDVPAGATALVIANPNNPDGRLTARPELLAALAQQESHGGWLIVDEAFADCDPGISIADVVGNGRRLVVTRSFGKFFGLAGVRLGFVLGPEDLLADLRKLQGEWPVCAAALSFGSAAYADAQWIEATREKLREMAARLDRMLAGHELVPGGACPLFRLLETGSAFRLFEGLARHRILTRPFSHHPRLLRVGLPAGEGELKRLNVALAKVRTDG